MAAAAYDAAALALRGNDAVLNFPDAVQRYPRPASSSPADIRSAAAAAAAMMEAGKEEKEEYVDMEALFDMPNFLVEMAGGLMISPPRIGPPPTPEEDDDDSTGNLDGLWSYD